MEEGTSLGIYFHVPFCTRRCDYCDFFITLSAASEMPPYFDTLRKDLEQETSRFKLGGAGVDSIYFGGGTPSLAGPDAIARILNECARLFDVSAGVETTLEANPETLGAGSIGGWMDAGINRLSLGMQSLSDRVLAPRGRLYSADEALAVAEGARREGMPAIGIDLIAGLPHETPESFGRGLARVVNEVSPDHLSIYLLETDESLKETALADAVRNGRTRLPEEEDVVAMYRNAVLTLRAAGYRHYEISNFCKQGMESRHNLKYWRSAPTMGIGPSAHSLLGGRRRGRPADLAAWSGWVERDTGDPGARGAPQDYTLEDPEARAREALVLELRLVDGVDTEAFTRRWSLDPLVRLRSEIDALAGERLLSVDGRRLRLTRTGLLMSNEVFARLT